MNFELISKAKCTIEEKKELLELVATIVSIAKIARQYGFLSLLGDVRAIKNKLLKITLKFGIDGFYSTDLEEIIMNMINLGEYSGKELLEKLIVYTGARFVFWGRERELKIKIFSLFGEEMMFDFLNNEKKYEDIFDKLNPLKEKYSKIKPSDIVDDIDEFIKSLINDLQEDS